MIKALLIMVLSLSSISLYAIQGTYSVTGFDPYEQKPYTGTVVITKDKHDVYQAHWTFQEGGQEYHDIGTGIRTKKQISFIFKNAPGQSAEYEGVQVYKIKGKTLEGPFVVLNKNTVGTEKLEKQ